MKDPHPEFIDIEIDRDGLRQYLRVTWFLGWVLSMSAFGLVMGAITTLEAIEKDGFEGVGGLLYDCLCRASVGASIGAAFGFILYLTLGHFRAKRVTEALQLRVEGPFLRVVQSGLVSRIDRKIHFRAIIDFSTIDNRRMQKFKIKTLQMNTMSGGPTGIIRIDGVKDCDRVRYMLAEIDRLRENEI